MNGLFLQNNFCCAVPYSVVKVFHLLESALKTFASTFDKNCHFHVHKFRFISFVVISFQDFGHFRFAARANSF